MSPDVVRARRVLVDGRWEAAAVCIAGGRITAVHAYDEPVSGEVLDVPDGQVVLPGVVDTHVHVNEPGRTEWEGFATATVAAARGGVTTLVDMPLNSIPPTTSVPHLRSKQVAASTKLAVDVGFWGGAVPGNLADLEPLWAAGVFGFKCFLSPSGVEEFPHLDDVDFRAALAEIARLGGLMIVHAEDPTVLRAAPHQPSRAYADFLLSRPDDAEVRAIERLIAGARDTGCRVHLLHLSSARALGLIADARAEGLPLTVETCPHYLTFESASIPDGDARFKCCPPIRDAGNRDALWEALLDGIVDIVVTDHSPSTVEEKERGGGDLQQAWGGISGLQVGFTAVAHEARQRGIGLERVSAWMSTGPADLVGLTSKGRIAVDADADLVVFDPAATRRVDADRLSHRNRISAYDGLWLDGAVVQTILGGTVLGPGVPRSGRMLTREAGSTP